jgi:hypothetical protein
MVGTLRERSPILPKKRGAWIAIGYSGFGLQSVPTSAFLIAWFASCAFLTNTSLARAQSIEPRAYSNVPVGVNFLIGGYAYAQGGISFDTSVPITDPKLTTNSAVVAYARTLDLWGTSGRGEPAGLGARGTVR